MVKTVEFACRLFFFCIPLTPKIDFYYVARLRNNGKITGKMIIMVTNVKNKVPNANESNHNNI